MILASLAAAAIVSTVTVDPVCVWNDRGLHRVTVPVSPLVDNYPDIPPETRARLKQRIDRYQYDEMAVISKDGIKSDLFTYSGMRYMHFGTGQKVCGEVKTDHWAPGDIERAMVFCEDGYCLAVPTVCSNLARVTRRDPVNRAPVVLIPPIEAPGGLVADFVSPGLTLTFVDPEPVFPMLTTIPEIEVAPEAEDWWPFTREMRWGPLLGPVVRSADVVKVPDGVVQAVPEPSTYVLMALGLAWAAWVTRRKA
jgi:hypothetical protein